MVFINTEDTPVYTQSSAEIADNYNTDQDHGLANSEAEERLKKYGSNELKQKSKISPVRILISQFKNIIVYLLLTATVIAFAIGDIVEALAVIAVIILNALFGFLTEYKAEKSVAALKKMVKKTAKVIREGELTEIAAAKVVPGDIIVLEEGDRITADGRLLEADNLNVDESILTGESEPVDKNISTLSETSTPLAEQSNMVFMGTAVTRGNGLAVVTATARDTEIGKISGLLDQTEDETTPLEERLDKMGKSLIYITLIIAAFITIIGVISGRKLLEMIETGIALAIAAVPEGLPAVATITLAIGMKKMARHNALVKRLPAVETLGSTTVICTDKTGTLTENQMTVNKIVMNQDTISVSGTGYQPEGKFKKNNQTLTPETDETLSLLLKAGTLCSNATIIEEDSLWKVVGDPTEGALVTAARKAGYNREEMEDKGYKRLQEIPFSSQQKYMAVAYSTPDDKQFTYLKGAPAVVLKQCQKYQTGTEVKPLTEELRENFSKQNRQLARSGMRVLGIAYKQHTEKDSQKELKDIITNDLIFLGMVGIIDPPRPDVKEAIAESQSAGIRIIMITGDQSDTALAIAEKVGININDSENKAIKGTEIEEIPLSDLTKLINDHSVFARVSPANKLDIVDALNENNQITAMTGDGVNDAPALKKADIGVAMGQRGTAVAREASDMVLLDDNFSTIVQAVKQGRVIFDNIKKFIYYLFSCNTSEIIFIFLGIILQVPVPLLALQILWLNLVTDVFPAMVLAWEVPETEIMSKPPLNPEQNIMTDKFKLKIGLHGLIIALGPLAVYLYTLSTGNPVITSRTAGFLTISFVQLFHVFNARRKTGSGFDHTVWQNPYLWGAIVLTISLQLLTIYFAPLRLVLETTILPLHMWLLIVIGSIVPVLIIQIWNQIRTISNDN